MLGATASWPLLTASALVLVLFIHFENLSILLKFNYAGKAQPLIGANLQGISALLARACVGVYGILVAFAIERASVTTVEYLTITVFVMALWVANCMWLSRRQVDVIPIVESVGRGAFAAVALATFRLRTHRARKTQFVDSRLKLFVGLQFLSPSIAYGLCIVWPHHRLLIISLMPVFSMAWSLVVVLLVDPTFARIVDSEGADANDAASRYLAIRALAFGVSLAASIGLLAHELSQS